VPDTESWQEREEPMRRLEGEIEARKRRDHGAKREEEPRASEQGDAGAHYGLNGR
jgi:hypothetical protein